MRELVDGLFTDFAQQQGKIRWAHKTPDDCLYAPFFTQLFPDARYLHITRHPLDVALSTARIPARHKGVSPWHEEHLLFERGCVAQNTLFNCVLRWRHWNDRIRADSGGSRLPSSVPTRIWSPNRRETMAGVCAFLDEPFDPGILEYAQSNTIFPAWERGSVDVRAAGRITPPGAGRWKTELYGRTRRACCFRSLIRAPRRTPPAAAIQPAARLASAAEIDSPLFAGMAGVERPGRSVRPPHIHRLEQGLGISLAVVQRPRPVATWPDPGARHRQREIAHALAAGRSSAPR